MERWFKNGKFTTINDKKDSNDPFYKNAQKMKEQIMKWSSKDPEYRKFNNEWRKRQRNAYRDFCTELCKQPVGSRGIWFAGWQMHLPPNWKTNPVQPMFYHAMNYEIKPEGPIFYDSQSKRHKVISNDNWDVYSVHPREYSYMRTDNLELDPSVVEAVISRKG